MTTGTIRNAHSSSVTSHWPAASHALASGGRSRVRGFASEGKEEVMEFIKRFCVRLSPCCFE